MQYGFSRRSFLLSSLGFGLSAMMPKASAAPMDQPFRLTFYGDYAPFSFGDGTAVQGLLIDLLGEALNKRMGLDVTYEGLPWKRAQTLVRKGGADAFCTIPNVERRAYTVISGEPVVNTGMKIFTRKHHAERDRLEKTKSLDSMSDLVFTGALGGGWQKTNIGDRGYQIKYRSTLAECLNLVVRGHADVFVGDKFILRDAIKKAGLENDIEEMPTFLKEVSYHLCIGKKSHYANRLAEFDKVIRAMKNDGAYDRILSRYL